MILKETLEFFLSMYPYTNVSIVNLYPCVGFLAAKLMACYSEDSMQKLAVT
jgi:hypothetical protein